MDKPKEIERECKHHGLALFYHNGRGYMCKKCNARNMMKCRHKVFEQLLEEIGAYCRICNYSKCKRALHFHHLDPKEKSFTISAYTRVTKLDKLKKEAKKCVLLCANCHAEVEAKVTLL